MPRIILLTDFSEDYANRLLKGIVRYSKGHGEWVLCKMPLSYRDVHKIEGVLDWALRWKADGIIAQFYNSDNVGLFRQHGIAAIAQDFRLRFTEIPNITGTHFAAGRMGADHFLGKGFRSFGFYGFKRIVWSEERCEGFRSEIEKHGYGDNFSEYRNIGADDLWYYESVSLREWLDALPKPCAIMACDDSRAYHIVEVCNLHGIRVPEEVAVLGVDNDEVVCTLSNPPLSSIEQDVEAGGYAAAMLMERMIADPGGKFEDVVVSATRVVTRRSTDVYATGDNYISAALRYIHENAGGKLGVEDVIARVPLARRLLETRFRQATGTSVYSYILGTRIEKFAQRLLETDDPITDVAMEMGFPDYKNIARQFRSVKGCTPTEYRDRGRGNRQHKMG
jgi:LacI family transcriptional regulator